MIATPLTPGVGIPGPYIVALRAGSTTSTIQGLHQTAGQQKWRKENPYIAVELILERDLHLEF